MRILFVTRSLPFHHVGGMEAVAWDLARALGERGHDVEILTTPAISLPKSCVREGVSIRTMDVRSGRYSKKYWQETVREYHENYLGQVDAVLGVGMGAHGIARSRQSNDKTNLVMQSHGQPWGEMVSKLKVPSVISWLKAVKNMRELLAERVLLRYDHLVAVGPAVSKVLTGAPMRWLVPNARISVIENGVNERHFSFDAEQRRSIRQELNISMDAPVIVSASRLHLQKGVKESLDGFREAYRHNPNLRYLILGTGPAESALIDHASAIGLSEAVTFVGAVDRARLAQYLSAADAFLFTSRRMEGLALGPLEASATGLKVILSQHLEVPGLSSTLVAPTCAEEVGMAILSSALVSAAPRKSSLPERYSLSNAARKYERILCRSADASG